MKEHKQQHDTQSQQGRNSGMIVFAGILMVAGLIISVISTVVVLKLYFSKKDEADPVIEESYIEQVEALPLAELQAPDGLLVEMD